MLVWAIGIGVGISLVAVAILGTSSTYNHCMVNFCAFYKWLGGGSVAIILRVLKNMRTVRICNILTIRLFFSFFLINWIKKCAEIQEDLKDPLTVGLRYSVWPPHTLEFLE